MIKTIDSLLSNTITTSSGCMEWQGAKGGHGYPITNHNGKNVYVTRLVLELLGNDMNGVCACHKCDNPPCINPDHLFAGTYSENTRDAIQKGRIVLKKKIIREFNPSPVLLFFQKAKSDFHKAVQDRNKEIRRQFREENMTMTDIARFWGINLGLVSKIIAGKR